MKNLKKIKGDASSRKFFRKKIRKITSVIVYTQKDKSKNLLAYDAVNKILIKNNVLAPSLYQENYNKNFIEIQDFGDQTVFKILKSKSTNKLILFKKIIKLLNKIQSIKSRSIKNFKKQKYIIPKYNNNVLIKEANLFCQWYADKNLPKGLKEKFTKKFLKIIKKLTLNLKLKNNVFVHRDFHASNLMLFNNKIGVIDSQDALIGNRAYDLASLVDDVRLKTPKSLKNKIYRLYMGKQKKLDEFKFKNDFEILSILRNLKIIGIFTRLAIRDGKKNYLKLIPYAWFLINMRINDNTVFIDLKKLLKESFKGKIK
ncbi:phosphotransferase [Candidatus Pelagibacter sp.]|nr:phosphotransferase [Candidatus Pelagibacter sp.]